MNYTLFVNLYADYIVSGDWTFDNVPGVLKNKVKTRLNELGYDEKGHLLVTDTEGQAE